MMKEAIEKLVDGKHLSEYEISGVMKQIMDGNATPAQIGSFITALRIKGETIEEITGCARVMREKAESIRPKLEYYIDTCGTGGDGANTFNISTAAAFVAAAGGVYVAKHGNRSISSKSGSADVLEALGIDISLTPDQVRECIEEVGIGFMFAPSFHKSMKHAAAPRRELGIRTVFNLLGPLTNPANAKGQVLGVYAARLTEPIANVLLNLGVEKALVIHGADGLDEITITTSTKISEVRDGEVLNYEINPQEYNLNTSDREDILGCDSQTNAEIIKSVFMGQKSAKRDIVILNSAAALYVGKVVNSISEGVLRSKDIIDSGRAMEKLDELRRYTQSLKK